MDSPKETDKNASSSDYSAVGIESGFPESLSFIDKSITSEYQFLRQSYESRYSPPHLVTGSLLVAGLAGYIFTHISGKPLHLTVYSLAEFIIFSICVLILIVSSSLMTRRRYPKIDKFALEDKLLELYRSAVLLAPDGQTSADEADAAVLARLRWNKVRLLEEQTKLYRIENRRHHYTSLVVTVAMLGALLMGGDPCERNCGGSGLIVRKRNIWGGVRGTYVRPDIFSDNRQWPYAPTTCL